MAIQVASLFGVLTLDDKQFQQSIDNAQSGLKTTAEKLQTFGGNMQKAGLLTMAAATPVLAFGANAVRSAGASQEAAAQLNAVLTSTGGVAGVTAEGAQALATNLQSVTRFSDETVLSGENMLLTFTNIGAKGGVFDQATVTTLDMATALGQDVTQSAMQLGKALNDPINGVTALQRVGVTFTDSQKAQIEAMVKSGDVMGAQTLILQELQREFGGSAVAAGKTFPGQLDIMTNKIDDANEKIGGALIPALSKVTEKLSPIIDDVSAWIEKNPDLVLGIGGVAGGAFVLGGVLSVVGTIVSVGGTLLSGLGLLLGILSGPVGLVVLIGGLVAAAAAGYPGGLPKLLSDAAESAQKLIKIIDWTLNKWVQDLAESFHNLAIYLGLATDASGRWEKGGVKSSGGGDFKYGDGGSGGGARGFRASGGPVMAGGAYIVGEQGPELFTPSTSGNISTAQQTAGMMGGMHIGAVNVYANSYAEGQAAAAGFMDKARSMGYSFG